MNHDSPENDKKSPASWRKIQSDLQSALDTWSTLSNQCQGRKSPEEVQLEDMRKLLSDLQEKLRCFEAPAESESPQT